MTGVHDASYLELALRLRRPLAGLRGYMNATGGFRAGIVAAPLAGEVIAQSCCGEPPTPSLDP